MKRQPILNSRRLIGAGNLITCLAFLYFCFQLFYHIYESSKNAMNEGRKIIISVATAEISGGRKNDLEPAIVENKEKPKENENDKPVILPVKNSNNTISSSKGSSRIAIIISNLGLNSEMTSEAMKLPPEVTLSFSPYAEKLQDLVDNSIGLGHEVLLDLPVETADYPLSDPGNLALLVSSGKAKNLFRIKTIQALAKGYVGFLAPPDEIITNSLSNIIPIISEFKSSDYLFIYNQKPSNEFMLDEAKSIGLRFVNNYMVVDEIPSQEEIEKQLREALRLATEEKKDVVLVIHPYIVSLQKISVWVNEYQKDERKIYPISQLASGG